jgi:hypothetical protein
VWTCDIPNSNTAIPFFSAKCFISPTPSVHVKRLEQGDRFYFLLKAPYRKIGGYGHFHY